MRARAIAIVVVVTSFVTVGTGLGQVEPPDLLGVYFDEGAMIRCWNTVTPFQSVTAYLCATGLTAPSGISYWECNFVIQGSGLIAPSWLVRHNGTNLLGAPLFSVFIGTDNPIPNTPAIVLASMTGFVEMPGYWVRFALDGIPDPAIPSLPHNPAYAAGNDLSDLRPFHRIWGDEHPEWPVACINDDYCWGVCVVPVDQTSWGLVKGLFRDATR
jgi:hypothetical protein